MNRPLWLLVLAMSTFCACNPAFAQTYPNKSIRLIVPGASGGNVDITGHIIGAALTESLGQNNEHTKE